MKVIMKRLSVLLVVLIIGAFFTQALIADEMVSVIGVVNNDAQIMTDDGELYFIGSSEVGSEVEALAGQRVEATGQLFDMSGDLYINITEYTVIEESTEK